MNPTEGRASGTSSEVPQGGIDARVGDFVAAVDALGIDAEQDFDAVPSAFGNLSCRYPGVEPQGDGSVPQIVGPPGKRDDLYSLDKYIVKMHHSAAGTAWRWRTELIVFSGLGAALYWLSRQIGMHWAPVVLAAAIGIAFSLPWSRRFITRRFWCVLARHRFHRLCWEARLHTRAGRLPIILWTRPTKVGERLFVWCRAGICASDLHQPHCR